MSFIIFAVAIVAIATALVLLNTYSDIQNKGVLAEAQKNSSELSENLLNIQENLLRSTSAMVQYLPETDAPARDAEYLERLALCVSAVSTDFAQQRELIQGYFYQINAEATTPELEVFCDIKTGVELHISMILGYLAQNELIRLESVLSQTGQPVWLTISQPIFNKYYLTCVAPLFANNEYIGFTGLVIDSLALKSEYPNLQTTESRFSFLLSSNNEFLAHDSYASGERLEYVDSKRLMPLAAAMRDSDKGTAQIVEPDGRIWIYAFDRMPSGQTYVEAQQLLRRVIGADLLILQMAVAAIIVTSLVQSWREGRYSFFDRISRAVLKHLSDVHPTELNSSRAVLALHVGMTGGAASYLVYSLISGSAHTVIYIALLTFLLIMFANYQIREEYRRKLMILLPVLSLLLPMYLQVMDYSFGGDQLMWVLVSIIGALFLTNRSNARNVFYAFVVVLFLYVLLQIFVLQLPQPQILMPVVSTLFFLGFALFSSVDVYVQSSKDDYVRLEETLLHLKNAQSMLVQHEKMVTLGQLVSGIAHEINTPLGAIKAAAETIDASLERLLRRLMDLGGTLDESGREGFFKLADMVSISVAEMNSTSQARKARTKIREFCKRFENGDNIADLLIRMEIINMDLISSNEQVFRHPQIELMLELLCDASPVLSSSQTIEFAVSRANKIVFALRSYSRTAAHGAHDRFDVAMSVENVLILYRNQLKQNIIITREYEEHLPPVNGSIDEIAQVWANLIQNAIQAMPEGGTLTISLRLSDDSFIEARFTDTGMGIPADIKDKIFDPFFTTKPLGEGSGLGLDISHKMVDRHNGTIEVISNPGEGSTFTVRLPVDKSLSVLQNPSPSGDETVML